MLTNLDNLSEIQKFDTGSILTSITSLPEQIEQGWNEVKEIKLPDSYKEATNIILAGMGGSALGARIVDSVFFEGLRVPFEIVTDYHLPRYVNSNTLVILSSYSGNTEETVTAAHEALKKNAKCFIITTGGKLGEFAQREQIPAYIFDPIHNPSKQPRMGLGYSIAALLSLLAKESFVDLEESELKKIIEISQSFVEKFGPRIPEEESISKKLARNLMGKGLILMASEHLVGIAHAFKNQLNENAKVFSALFELPEANHHLLEGLKYPLKPKENLTFLMFESKNYYNRVFRRYQITKEVIEKNGFPAHIYKTQSEKRIEEMFECLILGSYISFYLAVLYGVDPAALPWVDYFKEKMA